MDYVVLEKFRKLESRQRWILAFAALGIFGMIGFGYAAQPPQSQDPARTDAQQRAMDETDRKEASWERAKQRASAIAGDRLPELGILPKGASAIIVTPLGRAYIVTADGQATPVQMHGATGKYPNLKPIDRDFNFRLDMPEPAVEDVLPDPDTDPAK
jgi:hypothetical protein